MKNVQIYMIGGKARHGKDTTARFMKKHLEEKDKKVCIMHFSTYLNNMIRNYFGWDGNDETKPRQLLQILGYEIIRKKLNKECFLIDRLLEDIEILSNYYDTFIISDVRFPLEYDKVKAIYKNTIKIHVYRPGFESNLSDDEQKHISETALDEYNDYDYNIVNNSLEELEKEALKIVIEVSNNA